MWVEFMVSLKDKIFINIYLFHLFIIEFIRGRKYERGTKKEPYRYGHRRRRI